jgi:hypothetical protein
MQAHLSKEGEPSYEYLAWHPLRLQLKPVLDKLVSSIWYNVVNSGVVKSGQLGSDSSLLLPQELKNVCPRGHNLDSHKLGIVLNELQTKRREVMIESKNVISNLTLWLIYHFKGRLRVTVSSKIVYDEVLGPEECIIEHRTQKFCDSKGPCDLGDVNPTVRIYSSLSGGLKHLFRGHYDTKMTQEQSGRVRQKLYQSVRYPSGTAGKESIRVLARQTAHEIAKWLLYLPLSRRDLSNELCFSVSENANTANGKGKSLKIIDLLARVPSILNMDWGDLPAAVVVFAAPVHVQNEPATDPDSSDGGTDFDYDDLDVPNLNEATPECIIQHFPILKDLIQKVKKSCRCQECKSAKDRGKLQPGCLQHTAFMEVMTYIAHTVSDAFGADDCSAFVAQQMTDFGVLNILWEVIEGSIRWRTWFDTASRVLLGIQSIQAITGGDSEQEYPMKQGVIEMGNLISTVVALQYGNLAVVAPWLDISQPLGIKNCFGFQIVQGRLGVPAEDGSHFQSLQGNSAVIKTQHTDDVQNYAEKFPQAAEQAGSQVQIQPDVCEIRSAYIIVPSGENTYRLLMRVISGSHSRFLDPARAMIKSSLSFASVSCRHQIDRKIQLPESAPILKLYTFDQVLGRWPDNDPLEARYRGGSNREDESNEEDISEELSSSWHSPLPSPRESDREVNPMPKFRVSHLLGSYLEYNVALVLAYGEPTILNHGTACLACILEKGVKFRGLNGSSFIDESRWVICRIKNPDARDTGVYQPRRQAKKRLRAE